MWVQVQLFLPSCHLKFSFSHWLVSSVLPFENSLSVIDVDLIRAVIDLFYDGFRSRELLSRENPISVEQETEEEEKIRSLWTFVVSGLLDKQVRLYSFHASKARLSWKFWCYSLSKKTYLRCEQTLLSLNQKNMDSGNLVSDEDHIDSNLLLAASKYYTRYLLAPL